MRAKRVFEGYSQGVRYGTRAIGTTGANRFGRSCSGLSQMQPYVYQILQFNHTLEEKPTMRDEFNPIKVGDIVVGMQFKNKNDKTKHKGVVKSVKKTVDGMVERIGINDKGNTLWLDPSTVIGIDSIDNSLNKDVIICDDSMEFEDE